MHREKMDCHFDIVIHFLYIYLLGKGSKKNQLWKIPYRVPKNDKTTFKQANFCLLRCQILPRHAQ